MYDGSLVADRRRLVSGTPGQGKSRTRRAAVPACRTTARAAARGLRAHTCCPRLACVRTTAPASRERARDLRKVRSPVPMHALPCPAPNACALPTLTPLQLVCVRVQPGETAWPLTFCKAQWLFSRPRADISPLPTARPRCPPCSPFSRLMYSQRSSLDALQLQARPVCARCACDNNCRLTLALTAPRPCRITTMPLRSRSPAAFRLCSCRAKLGRMRCTRRAMPLTRTSALAVVQPS